MSEQLTWAQRSDRVIAQGTCTFSKYRDSYIHGPGLPTHVVDSDGVSITCDNGRSYVDCGCLGSALISVQDNYSLPCTSEVELAERIVDRVKCIQKLKFLKTGSDACMAAIRFARAFTGRSHVVWAGYHGTSNTFITCEQPGAGCVHEHSTKLADIHLLADYCQSKEFRSKPPAAVIWEPVILDAGQGVQRCNERIIEACSQHGTVSIMDEVVTGGRVPRFTVSNWWGLQPDLICMGKALGNGIPLALVGGREFIFDNRDVFISNTHNGSQDAMDAGLMSMDMLTDERIQLLWDAGMLLMEQFNRRADKANVPVHLKGIPTRFTWTGSTPEDVSLFWQEMAVEGFWCSISMFAKHTWYPHIFEGFLTAAQSVMDRWSVVELTCETFKPWFRRY